MDIAIIIGMSFIGLAAYNLVFGDKHDDKM